jgi:biopolymer transport protein ExbD
MSSHRSSLFGVASMMLLAAPMIACETSAEQEERARLRVEIDQLRAEMDRLGTELAAQRAAQPNGLEASAIEVARGHEVKQESPQTVLAVTRAGVEMDGKTLSAGELDAVLRELASKQPEASLVVRADEDASHEHVVALLDRAKAAGIHRFALATPAQPEPADAAR